MNIGLRVNNLVKRHQTRDPIRIAENLGISIKYKPYKNTKGYFIKVCTNKFIVINSNLDEFSQIVVAAHELGHALLHSSQKNALTYQKGVYIIEEYTLFPTNSIYENQANKFAAELLIHDDLCWDTNLSNTDLDIETYKRLIELKNLNIK